MQSLHLSLFLSIFLHTPALADLVAKFNSFFSSSRAYIRLLREVLGSMLVTGWDSLAHQAATIEWRGDGTNMALVVVEGLIIS